MSEIASADLHIAHYKHMASMEVDKEKRSKLNLKRQQLEDGKQLNGDILLFLGYKPGDEKTPFWEKVLNFLNI